MKRSFIIIFSLLCLCLAVGCAAQTSGTHEPLTEEQKQELIGQAQGITDSLSAGDFQSVFDGMDDTMQEELPVTALSGIWQGLSESMGEFHSADISGADAGQTDGFGVVEFPLEYEKGTLIQRTVFNSAGQLAGLFFRPAE